MPAAARIVLDLSVFGGPRLEGYLVEAPARPLEWGAEFADATSPLTLRFGPTEALADASSPTLSAEPPPAQLGSLEALPPVVMRPAAVVELPPPSPEAPAEPVEEGPIVARRVSILDQGFVDWVTRNLEEEKVEVPFQLPADGGLIELTPPTERVRLRYRDEP